ncbi:MAG: iron ABC transporter permease [Clostridium sp.]|uniref:FecCD family ABC transporter permease n=1 Tax=Clostridium sp. TaxID=1506 RepID=UPI0030545AB1
MNFIKKDKRKYCILFILLAIIVSITFCTCVGFGSVKIGISEVFNILTGNDIQNSVNHKIVWNIRFPRAIASLIGGCALAVSGLLLQIFFKNPIVEPYVLGVSSGATLCVAFIMLGGAKLGFESISPLNMFFAAFIGSLSITIIVVFFAGKVKSVVTLLVIGIMVGYICSSVTNVLVTFADKERLQGFTMWTLGSFSGFTWQSIKILVLIGVPTILATSFIVKPLNAFLLGEEYAESMGVRIKVLRVVIVLISSILAAVVTAFAGPVSFIGLAVPHISRLVFKTSDNRVLIPATILMGGIVTSLCDLASRTLLAPMELPISAVTSFIGAPIVIFLILKRRTSI